MIYWSILYENRTCCTNVSNNKASLFLVQYMNTIMILKVQWFLIEYLEAESSSHIISLNEHVTYDKQPQINYHLFLNYNNR